MKRFCYMIVAVIIIALGVTFLKLSSFGTDPFNCMNLGISSHLPISYGTYQMILNIVLFIPLFILKPSILGPGALANMFFSAYIVEGFSYMFTVLGITTDSIYEKKGCKMLFLLFGIICMCFGAALYMECNLGIAAYDALGQIVEEKMSGKVKYRMIRILTDTICIMIGAITGSVVGIGTFVGAFFTGPLISVFRKIVNEKIRLR